MENLESLFTNNQECSCSDGVCHLHKTNMQRTPQPRVSCPGRRDDPEVEKAEEDEIRHRTTGLTLRRAKSNDYLMPSSAFAIG